MRTQYIYQIYIDILRCIFVFFLLKVIVIGDATPSTTKKKLSGDEQGIIQHS